MFWVFSCGPLAITVAAWIRFLMSKRDKTVHSPGFISLMMVSANTTFAAYLAIRYTIYPVDSAAPPWENGEQMGFAGLFFLAPIGMIVTAIGGFRGVSKWLVLLLELASLLLVVIGLGAVIND